MKLGNYATKTVGLAVKNTLAMVVLGQIPPFTALPEEALTIPIAVGLSLFGVDAYSEAKKLVGW